MLLNKIPSITQFMFSYYKILNRFPSILRRLSRGNYWEKNKFFFIVFFTVFNLHSELLFHALPHKDLYTVTDLLRVFLPHTRLSLARFNQ
jgi:hypothetical protein